jgi:hypothetical protein
MNGCKRCPVEKFGLHGCKKFCGVAGMVDIMEFSPRKDGSRRSLLKALTMELRASKKGRGVAEAHSGGLAGRAIKPVLAVQQNRAVFACRP